MEGLLIDFVVIVLLGATIYFAFRLDRRLQSVRNVQSELASVIHELNSAAARAEAGIHGLKMAAQSTGQQLEQQIKSARDVGDELAVLLKSTEKPLHAATQFGSQRVANRQETSAQRPALDALRALSKAS